MFDRPSKKAKSECAVCYLAHDDEIHEATLRIHRWLFWQVTRNFIDDSFDASEPQSDETVI
jgi:hypothetical protein